MKRYWVFLVDSTKVGGMEDFLCDADTIEYAIEKINNFQMIFGNFTLSHVFDSYEQIVVYPERSYKINRYNEKIRTELSHQYFISNDWPFILETNGVFSYGKDIIKLEVDFANKNIKIFKDGNIVFSGGCSSVEKFEKIIYLMFFKN